MLGTFTPADWAIVIGYIATILGVGIFVNRYISRLDHYLVAGRGVGFGLAIATMVGTELGLVTIGYASQRGFTGGFASLHIPVVQFTMCVVIGLTGFIIYRLRKAGIMTLPEYYERRYGRRTRIVGGIFLVLAGILNMGMFLKVGAAFIGGLTGLDKAYQINLIMTVLLGIVFAYTILGGMISVVITDYLQFIVVGGSFLVVSILALRDIGWNGAVQAVVDHAQEIKGAEAIGGFNPLHGQGSFGPVYIIWMAFGTFALLCLWQPATVRALIARSPKVAKQAYLWSSLGFMIRWIIPIFWGICALAFVMNSETLREKFFPVDGKGLDTLMATPMYLRALLPPVVKGIVMAGLLAAFMSTFDSYLLCWAASITQDIIAPLRREELSPKSRVLITRLFVFFIGVFLLVWGLWYPLELGVWEYMAVTASIYSAGAFAVLAGGLYWKRASSTGAVIAIFIGLLAVLAILPWKNWGVESFVVRPEVIGLVSPIVGIIALMIGSLSFPSFLVRPEVIGLAVPLLGIIGLVIGSLCFPDTKREEVQE